MPKFRKEQKENNLVLLHFFEVSTFQVFDALIFLYFETLVTICMSLEFISV